VTKMPLDDVRPYDLAAALTLTVRELVNEADAAGVDVVLLKGRHTAEDMGRQAGSALPVRNQGVGRPRRRGLARRCCRPVIVRPRRSRSRATKGCGESLRVGG
jgi:hypothetical protein